MHSTGVKIDFIGGFEVATGSGPISISSAKAKALLACLCLSPTGGRSRETLAELLWEGSDPVKAGNNLRQTLKTLRGALGVDCDDVLQSPIREVKIARDAVSIDIELILEEISDGVVPQVLLTTRSITDDLLTGLDGLSIALDDFLRAERAKLQTRLEEALRARLQASDVASDLHGEAARALRNIDPTNEFAAYRHMEWLWKRGEPYAATKVFYELEEALDELAADAEPSPEIIELLRRVKLGLSNRPAISLTQVAAPAPALQLPTISVDTVSVDGLDDATSRLARAFRFDLIGAMSRFREWFVVDRTTTDLAPNYSLECHISPDLKFIALLRRETDGRYLWSELSDLSQESWGQSQKYIISRAASAVDVTISADRIETAAQGELQTPLAFDQWTKARSLVWVWRPQSFDQAISLIEDLLKTEGDFAQAHAELAALLNARHLFKPGVVLSNDVLSRAERHAEIATRLDPLDAKARRTLAWAHLMQRRYEAAQESFAEALQLNTSDPLTQVSSALGLAYCEDFALANEGLLRSRELQSNPPPFFRGYAATQLILEERYEEALEEIDAATGAIANLHGWEAIARRQLGDMPRATSAVSRFLTLSRADWSGSAPPDAEALVRWFGESFPIRRQTMRATFTEALTEAFAQ